MNCRPAGSFDNGPFGTTTSGKVKRIRNNPTVTLRPCDARGRVPDSTVTVTAFTRSAVADCVVHLHLD